METLNAALKQSTEGRGLKLETKEVRGFFDIRGFVDDAVNEIISKTVQKTLDEEEQRKKLSVPTQEEIDKRIREGVTLREAELWLADELENAAMLLRKEDERQATLADMHKCERMLHHVISTVCRAVLTKSQSATA
jgi:hypothetical protein